MTARFASITADILARKGEARPWGDTSSPPLLRADPVPLLITPPPLPPSPKERSCGVRMSAQDFERLGILAVKSGLTRQQLLKQALAEFLAARARGTACACLKNGEAGACAQTCEG